MMLAIADFADDDGNAYPSVTTLALKCRTTPRNANRILAALRDSGELEVRINEGPKGTNRYRVVFDRMTPASPLTRTTPRHAASAPLTPASSPPDAHVLKPLTPTSDEPSLNHQRTTKEPSEGGASRRSRRCPSSFTVTEDLNDWAREKHPRVDLRAETAKFRDHEFEKPKFDWPAAWRNWIRKADEFDRTPHGAPQRQSATERKVATIDALTGRARRTPQSFTDIDYTEGVGHDGIVQG
jgi:hypothetical protein